jgi:hypothetical protein
VQGRALHERQVCDKDSMPCDVDLKRGFAQVQAAAQSRKVGTVRILPRKLGILFFSALENWFLGFKTLVQFLIYFRIVFFFVFKGLPLARSARVLVGELGAGSRYW